MSEKKTRKPTFLEELASRINEWGTDLDDDHLHDLLDELIEAAGHDVKIQNMLNLLIRRRRAEIEERHADMERLDALHGE